MSEAAIVFAVQFAYILLLGLQQQIVTGGHHWAAATNSLLLGMCGMYLTGSIAKQAIIASDLRIAVAFLAAGPCGIVSSMWLYPRAKKWMTSFSTSGENQ